MFDELLGYEDDRSDASVEAHRLGDVLAELLLQYERAYPDIRIAIVETPAAA